ncbi:hypothetical protein L6V77_03595 [Myxococcota bacterium]|nr:hypothetical protein [Myxococcota bacterium]
MIMRIPASLDRAVTRSPVTQALFYATYEGRRAARPPGEYPGEFRPDGDSGDLLGGLLDNAEVEAITEIAARLKAGTAIRLLLPEVRNGDLRPIVVQKPRAAFRGFALPIAKLLLSAQVVSRILR